LEVQRDRILRAITDDGAFRVVAVRMTDTAQGGIAAQGAQGDTAATLGEVLCASVLIRETMAPDYRLQMILKDSVGNHVVGDAHPQGRTRGLVSVASEATGLLLGDDSILKIIRMLPNHEMHQGIVSAGLGEGVAGAVMTYLQQSEQVTSMVGIRCLVEGDRVIAAGGYVVQLLPEVTEAPLAIMTERLEDFRDIEGLLVSTDANPEHMISELLYGFPYTMLSDSPVGFHCGCDASRVVGAMATLGREELSQLIEDKEVVEISCDYCATVYEVGPEQFRTLLDTN
jgi:molecular chaperone Hsp33